MGIQWQQPQPQQPPPPDDPPPPDVRLDDGSEFYSAKQLAKLNEWKDRQLDQRLDAFAQRFNPLMQQFVRGQMQEQATKQAGDILSHYRSNPRYPSFTRLEPQIKQLMVEDASLSLSDAYVIAVEASAAANTASLQVQHATDRASQLSRKAAASAPPPGAPTAVTPLRDRDRASSDIAREELMRAGMA